MRPRSTLFARRDEFPTLSNAIHDLHSTLRARVDARVDGQVWQKSARPSEGTARLSRMSTALGFARATHGVLGVQVLPTRAWGRR